MSDSYASIIVPLDGSAIAEGAIRFALTIAGRTGTRARVELVHVHDEGVFVANAPMMDSRWDDDRAGEMGGAVRAVAERLTRETGLAVTAVTLRGTAAAALLEHAADRAADLIVMTTHGRSGFSRAWFGSVAERVIHASTIPVLVVRVGEHERADVAEPLFRHVLLPIDREQSGAEAMQRALAVGTPGRTAYTLLTVVSPLPVLPPPYPTAGVFVGGGDLARSVAEASALLERIAAPAQAGGAAVDIRVATHDRAAPAILEVAESGADLIVLPTHPRSAFSRALLGSVVDKVMRGARVPVLLFRASPTTEILPKA